MDYLSRKTSGQSFGYAVEDKLKNSIFCKFCNDIIDCISTDELNALCEKYLTQDVINVLKDEELMECINVFFNNDLNLSLTSKNAFLHRNTLIYRIDKVFKLTGFNVRNFEDALSFKILSVAYAKLVERTGGR